MTEIVLHFSKSGSFHSKSQDLKKTPNLKAFNETAVINSRSRTHKIIFFGKGKQVKFLLRYTKI